MLALDASAAVEGKEMSPEVLENAGALAAAACSPISDARGTAEYRRQVVAVLVARALRIAWLRAVGGWPEGVLARQNGVLSEDGS
jgi:carbon-monoxide dehydrogenase medium subunit